MRLKNSIFVLIVFTLFLPALAGAILVPDTGSSSARTCNFHSYTDLGNGIIKDNVTGLMWQKLSPPVEYTWDASNAYCQALDLGDYSDWRLPTVKELTSLIEHSIPMPGPKINTTYFPYTGQAAYWSSDISAEYSGSAWIVFFTNGYNGALFKDLKYNVRAVRGSELKNKFIDNGDGTIIDNSTGLIWQKEIQNTTYTWQQARFYCRSLFLGGHFGWRLPTYNELLSIVSYDRTYPAIDTQYFPDTDGYFWTSTVSFSSYMFLADTILINFDRGSSGPTSTSMNYVRAVRAGRCGLLTFCPAETVLGKESTYLENLRYFRDSKLAQSTIGRKVIQIYYNNTDSINAALDSSPTLRAVTRRLLEVIAPMMGKKEE